MIKSCWSIAAVVVLVGGVFGGCAHRCPPQSSRQTLPEPTKPSPTPGGADPKLVEQLKLRCARIALQTSTDKPHKQLDLEQLSAEGGQANVFVKGSSVRIVGELLGESVRLHVDYRYRDKKLVCSREMRTSMETIYGCDEKGQPRGECRAAFWVSTYRVFSGDKAIHTNRDHAAYPQDDPSATTETLRLAAELLARAR